MKKLACVAASLLLLLTCAACGAAEDVPMKEVRIEKRMAEDDSLLYTAETEETLDELEEHLFADRSVDTLAELPEDAVELYVYVVFQEGTLLAGQDPEEPRPLEELLRFTLYEDSDLITMQIAPGMEESIPLLGDLLQVTYHAPQESVDFLLTYGM